MTAIAANSPYALFETNKDVEQHGVEIDYGPFYFVVARAGGANNRFRDTLRARMAPHKRALATDTLSEDLADKISLDVFAETVVLNWGSPAPDAKLSDAENHAKGNFGKGFIASREGEPIAFSPEAVKQLFTDLPDLARDVMSQAQNQALFRATIAAVDAKN